MIFNPSLIKRFIKPLPVVIAVQLFFLIYAVSAGHNYTNDSFEYLRQAGNLLHHGSLYCGNLEDAVRDFSLYSRRPPGYSIFLIITSLFLHIHLLPLFIQALLSVFNVYTGYKILQLVFKGKTSRWGYTFLFLFFPSQFIYAATFMTEIPFQTTLLLCIYYLIRFEKEGSMKHLYFSHLFIAFSYLFKPIAVLLWVPLTLYSITLKSGNNSSQRLSLLALSHFVLIGAFFIMNYFISGIAEYSSVGRKVLINYSIPAVLTRSYGHEIAEQQLDSLQNVISGAPYVLQCVYTDNFIRSTLLTRPFDFVTSYCIGIIKFFLETCRWDLEVWRNGPAFTDSTSSLQKAFTVNGFGGLLTIFKKWPLVYAVYYFLVVLSTFCVVILFMRGLFSGQILRRYTFLLCLIIFYFALLSGPSSSARFRLPVYPLIAIIAYAGLPIAKKTTFISSEKK